MEVCELLIVCSLRVIHSLELYSGIPSIGQETLMVIYKSNLEDVFKDLSMDFKVNFS